MSGEWLPLVAVLVLGLVSGLGAALFLRRSPADEAPVDADRSLELADLERRRDNLYARLRSSENEADLERLEISAARVLRDIDRLKEASPGLVGEVRPAVEEKPEGAESVVPVAGPSVGTPVGHPMLMGFLAGGAMVALVGVLIYWALNDAQPPARSRAGEWWGDDGRGAPDVSAAA